MPTGITSKQALVAYLAEAAILEQQFMCQYLYATFSLKKAPDATCSAAQFERVRRWASTLYLVARQEMEHLSVVNSILTAVGGTPVFYHLAFPTQSAWLQGTARATREPSARRTACDLPFLMSPFDLSTVHRFCCMESPALANIPDADRARVETWCFEDAHGHCSCAGPHPHAVAPRFALVREARDHVARAVGAQDAREVAFLARPATAKRPPRVPPETVEAPPDDVQLGTIEQLYTAILDGLRYLDRTLAPGELFNGRASGQSEIPTEYQVYLFPITDLASAVAGVKMIMEQGEGIAAAPGYNAHFQLFYDMAVEYEQVLADDPAFAPAMPIALDPVASQYDEPVTRLAVQLWREGYATLLYMLAGYYAHYTQQGFGSYPFLSAALEQTAFAPLMTMFIRSLGEVIAGLSGHPFAALAGVDFNLTAAERALLFDPSQPVFTDIDFFRGHVGSLIAGLEVLENAAGVPAALVPRITYIRQNMHRVWGNLAQIYRNGIFPNFNPNAPSPS